MDINFDNNFNQEQRNAYLKIANYMNLVKKIKCSYFLLNGPGGSGKTYVLQNLIDNCKLRIKVLAPTHKAVGVIQKDLKKIKVETVAKFLGYSEEITDEGEKVVVYNYKPKTVIDLVIVDECSMISKEQVEVFKKTGLNILFVGDDCQLNPVNEEISQIYKLEFYDKAQLVKNERIKDVQIGETIINFRDSVSKNYMIRKCMDNKVAQRSVFDKLLIESFKSDEETVYIAYTNLQVKAYNNYIRKELFGPVIDDYIKGEKVIFTEYYVSCLGDKFYTSQKAVVTKCHKKTMKVNYPSCICNVKNFKDIPLFSKDEKPYKIEKCKKCHTPTSLASYKEFDFWLIQLDDNTECTFFKPVNGMKEIYNLVYKYRDRCKMTKTSAIWKDYYNMIAILNTPIEYIYSITVHKSQGSGYDNVFVDMENIMFCNKEYEKLRLAYTAVSRARKNLTFKNKNLTFKNKILTFKK